MENKQFKIAVTFGRFNLLHKGHIMLFQQMADYADEVIIGVSNNSKNLSFTNRKLVIDLALEPLGINYTVVEASNPFDLFDQVNNREKALLKEIDDDRDPNLVTAFFGEDQNSLAIAAHRVYGWVPKTIERLSSSTVVRALIDNEEWDLLGKIVPSRIISNVIRLRKCERNRRPSSVLPYNSATN